MRKYFTFLLFFSLYVNSQTIGISSFATGFAQLTEIKHAGDSRLFVVEKSGTIKIVNSNGTVNTTPFLNISSLISTGSERGLLGLAFHPNYATNGYFYVNYTNTSGNTVIARYSVNSTNANLANSSSAVILLTIAQPYSNHNGGCINFGPDGYLWISMGDGGGGGDPNNYAQNKNSLLGKMLRIDVDGASPYAIPSTNPFQGANEKSEIWYYGLRNAWKFTFDSQTNDVWIADVGQNAVEEINKVNYQTPGLNLGWKCYEGNSVYSSGGNCNTPSNFTFPHVQYTHSNTSACSVTGGYVYRGSLYPNMYGKYFFADFCINKIGMVNNGVITYSSNIPANNISTFGVDYNNEIYLFSTTTGVIYKLIDTAHVGVEEQNIKNVKLYPNPTHSVVNLELTNLSLPAEIKVFDTTGKMIHELTTSVIHHQIDIQNWQKGLYMVDVIDAKEDRQIVKLLVE